ncbi:Fpg/Nei family DNA glycosylase [Yimella sp. cx-51]|uniref:Fpg/Nei family DNA glycosylase n=1 Tax=Yimella sp. cx-51 TaxID=2770551 RepID=UPI00165E3CE9|nr:Fpg/Nei family DNA glycosylase [Yimella sp. cx-51]MBC9957928.1 Fpg/Nei family DNA glycosylase [Yimella sp. cx-51]QTH38062.1 Fpg/Nei family DNA glycosylase [Yimella sp. cx-51]
MPELPEVEALAGFLRQRVEGVAVADVELASFNVLKTYSPAPQALCGLFVTDVRRHGKWIDVDVDGLHLVFHLSRAGWLRWYDKAPATRLRPGSKTPIALRVSFEDGSAFDLTEQGTQKRLAAYIVKDPVAEIPQIASLGPDALSDDFTVESFAALLAGKKAQIKGVLRDQSVIAGVGNAYSDEVLHVAKISPYAKADSLDAEKVSRLYEAMRDTLSGAIEAASGKPAAELKDAKRAGMRVHGRTGQECPECGDVVREVSFADRSMQYCATCQTGGKPLADRRMSRLLK